MEEHEGGQRIAQIIRARKHDVKPFGIRMSLCVAEKRFTLQVEAPRICTDWIHAVRKRRRHTRSILGAVVIGSCAAEGVVVSSQFRWCQR